MWTFLLCVANFLAINVRYYFKPAFKRNERCWYLHLTLTCCSCNIFLAIKDRCYFKTSVERNEKCWLFHLNLARCHVFGYRRWLSTVFDTCLSITFFSKTIAIDSFVTKTCNKQVNTKTYLSVVKLTDVPFPWQQK